MGHPGYSGVLIWVKLRAMPSLNKSNILLGLRCPKALHMMQHHPARADTRTTPAMVTGQLVGDKARLLFPGGVLVERGGGSDPFAKTQALMADPHIPAIFEAGFQAEGVSVFVDVLERDDAGWNLIEVKSGTSVKEHHIDDVAVQFHVLRQCGIELAGAYLMHINDEYDLDNDGLELLFAKEDISEEVSHHVDFIAGEITRLGEVISQGEPKRHIGSWCKNPNPCSFYGYCQSIDAQYPVTFLPRLKPERVEQLHAQGIYDIRDLDPAELGSDVQRWVWRVTRSGQAELLPGARSLIAALAYPRYYLDFEAIQFAIPIWPQTAPYTQVPFQWSCHVESTTGELVHREFLDISGEDPRRLFAEALIDNCGSDGPVVVYHQQFERGRINELANRFPDLREALHAITARLFDLLPVVRNYYYHPAMKGSWSIKKVLPCLAPQLDYASLGSVQDGTEAQAAYLNIITGQVTGSERSRLIEALREYCKLDTLAMVKIAHHLTPSTGIPS